jgi:hypothetical protein
MEENNINGNMPTEPQLNTIRRLASQTRSYVDIKQISSKKQASGIIEGLMAKKNGSNGNGNGNNDCREKKVMYGLAVKLVFAKYQQANIGYNTENFWKDVDEFFQQYLEHQDRATKLGSQR